MSIMNRVAGAAVTLGLVLGAAVGVSSVANADHTFTLRIDSGHPSAPTAYVDSMEHFFVPEVTKRVAERTDHKVRFIEAYAGTIASVFETMEAVEKGLLDIGGWCQCFEPTKALGMNITYFVPFTTPDGLEQVKVFRQLLTEYPELYEDYSGKYNQTLIAISGFDNYGLGTTFAWDKTEELKGRKILGAGPNLPWISMSGALPVTSGKLGKNGYSTTMSSCPLRLPAWSMASPEPNRKCGGNTSARNPFMKASRSRPFVALESESPAAWAPRSMC